MGGMGLGVDTAWVGVLLSYMVLVQTHMGAIKQHPARSSLVELCEQQHTLLAVL